MAATLAREQNSMPKKDDGKNGIALEKKPLFEGLSDKDIQTLYKLVPVKKMKRGDYLIKEGHADQSAFAILDGEIKIVKKFRGKLVPIASLEKGDWLGEIAFTQKIPRTASAVAMAPSTVMMFTEAVMDRLEPQLQVYIYRRLNDIAAVRIRHLAVRELELANKNAALVEYIHSTRGRGKKDYGSSEMVRAIISKIPRLPAFATTLTVRMLDENVSPAEVADGVKDDPSLAAMVLKRVNSAYYGFQRRIADIHQAVVLLGLNEVYQLVLTEGLKRTIPDKPVFQNLLTHSIAVSRLSFIIALESKACKPTEAATIGLLHTLGATIIQLLKEKNKNLSLLIDKLDNCQLGAILLKEWNLPEEVHRTVEHQATPEFSPPEMVPEDIRGFVSVLFVAQMAAGYIQGMTEYELPMMFWGDYIKEIGWKDMSLQDVMEKRLEPVILQKMSAFPAHFRDMMAEYKPDVFRERRFLR